MTPDQPDITPQEPSGNGILRDRGSIDTTAIGILGGATAQIDVVLPGIRNEDAGDDGIVDDEIGMDAVAAAVGTDGLAATGGQRNDPAPGAQGADQPAGDESAGGDAPGPADHGHAGDRDAHGGDASAPADDADEAVVIAEIDDEPEAAIAGAAPVPPAFGSAAVASAPSPAPATGIARAAAVTPATTSPPEHLRTRTSGMRLRSKRIDQLDAGREGADLLTADRLLEPARVVRSEPEGGWQHFVYAVSGGRLNLGDGKRARARKELDARIAARLRGGAKFIPVVSRKGGVGKTTVTVLLGMALADARDDRVIAIDANPDRGTLADRIAHADGRTVRDLARTKDRINGYNDVSDAVARDSTRLDVLASDTDPRVFEAFSDRDYDDVAALAAHYYSIILTDTGTGIVHSVMSATLGAADQLVVVSGLSIDEARLASETLTWLESNGYAARVRDAVVVLNASRPGAPLVRETELEAHFRTRVRAVVRLPYDPLIATGSTIVFRDLRPETRHAARELAAMVVEGLRSSASAVA